MRGHASLFRRPLALLLVIATAIAFAGTDGLLTRAAAHDGVEHDTTEDAADHAEHAVEEAPASPFPLDIRAEFDLIDQTGARRTEEDFAGAPMLVFFGYASCESICSVALPRIAGALDILVDAGAELQPILITVDPANDTPQALARAMPRIHPRMIGLTGTEARLAAARDVFQVEAGKVSERADGAPIYSHGSFIYLLDGRGRVLTILPPILSAERIASLIRKYI